MRQCITCIFSREWSPRVRRDPWRLTVEAPTLSALCSTPQTPLRIRGLRPSLTVWGRRDGGHNGEHEGRSGWMFPTGAPFASFPTYSLTIMHSRMSRYLASFATALLLFAMTLPVAQAQMGMSPAKIGLRGGLTQATLYGDDIAKSDFRPGFTGGLFFTYRANKAFSIQPEVLYSVRGGKNVDLDATTAEESIRARHDFLEIPVLLKLTAPLNKIKPRLFVGPAIGFLLNSELNGADADDSFKSVDWGRTGHKRGPRHGRRPRRNCPRRALQPGPRQSGGHRGPRCRPNERPHRHS